MVNLNFQKKSFLTIINQHEPSVSEQRGLEDHPASS